MEINFSHSQLNKLFPFHVIIDRNLKIIEEGSSLKKITQSLIGKEFSCFFSIIRPHHFVEFSFDDLKTEFNYIIKHENSKTNFKATFELLPNNLGVFFLTPWFNTIDQLKVHNLLISDFSYVDQTFDLLHVINNLDINNEEVKELVKLLRNKNNQISLQEEKYRNIIENMNLGILEVDNEDVILYANQTFCNLSGYSLEELRGKNAFNLLTKQAEKSDFDAILKERQNGVSGNFTNIVFTKSGEQKVWFISGAPNYNDNGEIIGSIGAHLDVTEQKELEKKLELALNQATEASKAKELFLANISHEIRTPLNAIIGLLRIIDQEIESTNSSLHGYLDQARISANYLLSIINDVLDLTKIESGEMSLFKKDFHIIDLIDIVNKMLLPSATKKQIEFIVKHNFNENTLYFADDLRIKQILLNLINNAIKFTNHGHVLFEVNLLDSKNDFDIVEFTVADSGIGMTEEFLIKVFDKFSQEVNTSTRLNTGTGLGMAICKELLHLMGSELNIVSTKKVGTTIKFQLQLQKLITNNNNSKIQSKSTILEKKNVLIVEDNKINRLIVKKILQKNGCKFDEAENGEEAIKKVIHNNYDLILMDIQMPVMDGMDATNILLNQHKIKTPIIALTANALKKDIDSYLNAGMVDYIIKPIDEDVFMSKILSAITIDLI
jgi:PAS domain S-box-containing protein